MRHPIRLRATRRGPEHKRDALLIECGESKRVLEAWRQGGLPHELVHAAVESVFPWRGFVRLVAEGREPKSIEARDALPETLWAEALTNAFQAQIGGVVGPSDADLRAYLAQIHARALPPISAAELELVRDRIHEWNARWAALRAGESLEITIAAG
jgi:hypothetical protein